MRECLWKNYAVPSEVLTIATLEVQMEVVREKIAPHLERLRALRDQRKVIVNKARNRGTYWRRKAKR